MKKTEFIYDTEEEANACLEGVEFVNDSSLDAEIKRRGRFWVVVAVDHQESFSESIFRRVRERELAEKKQAKALALNRKALGPLLPPA